MTRSNRSAKELLPKLTSGPALQSKPQPQPRPKHPARSTSKPQQVRIIGGQWKRTPLAVQEIAGLRPTPDRVRETVFNWLTHLLDGRWAAVRCLDLFAGTGALGFEAASRGAANVVLVESHSGAVRQLEATRAKLNAEQVGIRQGDAFLVAQRLVAGPERFDLIFLDPPYRQDWLPKMLPLCRQLLAAGGMVYAESEQPLTVDSPPDWLREWKILRSDKAGMVFYNLLQCNNIARF